MDRRIDALEAKRAVLLKMAVSGLFSKEAGESFDELADWMQSG